MIQRLVPAFVLLAGCALGPTLEDGFEHDLTTSGGCADVVFFAVDAGDTTLLTVNAPGLVAAAYAAGETTTTDFALPDAGVDVIVEVGTKISDAICDDVIENGGPTVRGTWMANAGTASITIVPGETSEWDSRGTLSLKDVVFEAEDGDEVTVPDFDVTDIAVGWLAG